MKTATLSFPDLVICSGVRADPDAAEEPELLAEPLPASLGVAAEGPQAAMEAIIAIVAPVASVARINRFTTLAVMIPLSSYLSYGRPWRRFRRIPPDEYVKSSSGLLILVLIPPALIGEGGQEALRPVTGRVSEEGLRIVGLFNQ